MMPSIADFKVASMQATIFTPDLSFQQQKILKYFLGKWGERFDDIPISMPVPPEVEKEIPRIILNSLDKNFKIEFSPARVNLFWIYGKEGDYYSIKDFYNFSQEILCNYNDFLRGRIGRIAAVLNRFLKLDNPTKFLVEQFCKEKWINKSFKALENFELHSHKRYKLADYFPINSWIRFKTGFIGLKTKKDLVLTTEQDLNTLAEESGEKGYSNDEIKKFFKEAAREFDKILSLYFPLEK
jgi:hypothetical protein